MDLEEVWPPELESDGPEEEWLMLRWVVAKDFWVGALEERVVEDIFVDDEQ